MSFKQKIASAIVTGFAVVSFSAFASAQDSTNQTQDSMQKQEKRERRGYGKRGEGRMGKEGRGKHHGGRMGMRHLRELNLTDAQKLQVRDIMKANRASNPEIFQEMRTLSEARRSGTITADQTDRLKAIKQQMRQNAEQTHNQVLAILTAEQRTQLEQLKQQKREQKKERREMRRNQKNSDTTNDDNF